LADGYSNTLPKPSKSSARWTSLIGSDYGAQEGVVNFPLSAGGEGIGRDGGSRHDPPLTPPHEWGGELGHRSNVRALVLTRFAKSLESHPFTQQIQLYSIEA
jgi:hypothetical protein